jgi:hypothetical protein
VDLPRKSLEGLMQIGGVFAPKSTRMLNKSLQQTSIDLNTVENNPSFLYSEVPKHLDSWKDTQLFFNNLWEILKELKFTDDEIGVAWGVILYP